MKKIILSGRSENKYSSPAISIIQIETETVFCVSPLDFGHLERNMQRGDDDVPQDNGGEF